MDLPQDIIHNILSFLGQKACEKEAARTSVLSKAWSNAWQTRPVLRFHQLRFHKHTDFVNHVNSTLLRFQDRRMSIEQLELTGLFSGHAELLFNTWLRIAAERGVKKLILSCNLGSHTLPSIILQANSLEHLRLVGYRDESRWKLQDVPQNISRNQLKRLDLWLIRLDDLMLHNLLSSFPLIEFLDLFFCHGLKNFEVTNLQNLRELRICSAVKLRRIKISSRTLEKLALEMLEFQEYESMELEIECPSIVSFIYHGTISRLSFTGGSRQTVSIVYIAIDGNIEPSWPLKLHNFLANFIPTDISLKIRFIGRHKQEISVVRASLAFFEPHLRKLEILR